jgi:methylmalonyl-CoA mutase C-terminal domain/subunit
MDGRAIRILIGKPGLDGHDRGAKVVAKALRDAGFEVIYTGLHQTPEQIVATALQESVDVIGLSILSGGQIALVTRIVHLLQEKQVENISIIVGGIIPHADREILKGLGVAGIFGPGTTSKEIVQFIKEVVFRGAGNGSTKGEKYG